MRPSANDSKINELARIAIHGSAGPGEAPAILEAARAAAASGADVTVDCQQAEHLHAAVIQILICLQRELEGNGRKLVLANVPPTVQRFLDVAGVAKVLGAEVAR